jgi:hypothetical protein
MNTIDPNAGIEVLQTGLDSRLSDIHEALLKQADAESVHTGILLTTSGLNDRLDALDGAEDTPSIPQTQWLALFNALQGSTIGQASPIGDMIQVEPQVPTQAVNTGVAEDNGKTEVVPIFIADVNYQRLRKRWFAHLERASKSPDMTASSNAVQLRDVMARKHAFFASVLLPPDCDLFTRIDGKHYGKHIRLTLPPDGYRSNTGRTAARVDLRFADGSTATLVPGQVIEHEFSDFGMQEVELTLHADDGSTQRARFHFEVAASAPKPDETWFFNEPNGKLAATAWVYYGRPVRSPPRTKIEKPVLLAEGFPGGRTLDQLWPLVNQSHFARELIGNGRDFIILGFSDGTRRLQENADYYESCVKRIIEKKNNGEKIAAGGASMGGLVARYALCKMEKTGFDHQCNLYFTVDTPHEGANIPVSIQAFVQLYAAKPCGGAAEPSARQLASPSAQQMLLQWIPPYAQWQSGRQYPLASPERQRFVDDLRAQGWMPQKLRRVGVADGVGTGVGNGVPEGAYALKFSLSIWHWADMWAARQVPNKVVAMVNGDEQWEWRHGAQRIDGAPGGTTNSWQVAFDNLPGWFNRLYHPNHCFVPATSACAIASHDLYINNLAQRPSDLHAFKFSSTTNLGHVVLPVELKSFLVEQILNAAVTDSVQVEELATAG